MVKVSRAPNSAGTTKLASMACVLFKWKGFLLRTICKSCYRKLSLNLEWHNFLSYYCYSVGTQVSNHKNSLWIVFAESKFFTTEPELTIWAELHWLRDRLKQNARYMAATKKIWKKDGSVHGKHKVTCGICFCKEGFLQKMYLQGEVHFGNNSCKQKMLDFFFF